jgi:adenine deaminase
MNCVMKFFLTFVICACVTTGLSAAEQPSMVLKAAHFVDVVSGKVVDNQMVLIEGDTIKAVGPDLKPPAGAKIVDLGNSWILPGLIDCHTHLTFQVENCAHYLCRFCGCGARQRMEVARAFGGKGP